MSEKYRVVFKTSVDITDLYEIKDRPRNPGEDMSFTKEQISRSQQLRNAIHMGIAILYGVKLEDLEKTMRARVIPQKPISSKAPVVVSPIVGTPMPSPSLASVIPSHEVKEEELSTGKRSVVYHDELGPFLEKVLKLHEKRVLQIVGQNFSRKGADVVSKPAESVEPPSHESSEPEHEKAVPQVSKVRKPKKKKLRVQKKVKAVVSVPKKKVGKPEDYSSAGGGGQSMDHQKKPESLKLRSVKKLTKKIKAGPDMF